MFETSDGDDLLDLVLNELFRFTSVIAAVIDEIRLSPSLATLEILFP